MKNFKLIAAFVLVSVFCLGFCPKLYADANAVTTEYESHYENEGYTLIDFYSNERNSASGLIFDGKACLSTDYGLWGGYFGSISTTVWIYDSRFDRYDKNDFGYQTLKQIHELIVDVDNKCNTQTSTSDVFKFNALKQGQSVSVSNEVAEMISVAREMFVATNGAFDPSVYRLVDLWGFSSRVYGAADDKLGAANGGEAYDRTWQDGSYPLPQQKYVDAFKTLCDFSRVALSGNEQDGYVLTKNCSPAVVDGVSYEQTIDLGGIAKGWCADEILALLQSLSFDKGYVNVGTSSFAFLKYSNGNSFDLGLNHPEPTADVSTYVRFPIENQTLSTSGEYVRNYTVNGVEYSHIIDPDTGAPAQTGISTATVFGLDSAKDDCLTTALTTMTPEEITAFMNGDFCKNSSLKVIALHKNTTASKPVFELITNLDKSAFSKIDDTIYFATTQVDGVFSYSPSSTENPPSDKGCFSTAAFAPLTFLALAAFALFRRKNGEMIVKAKKTPLFVKGDVVVYALCLSLIVVLLVVFLSGAKVPVTTFYVLDMTNQKVVCSFDVGTKTFTDKKLSGFTLKTTEEGNLFTIEIERDAQNETWHNVLQIDVEAKSAKMISADCNTRECIYNFGAVDNENATIVCSAHRLKVVAKLPVDDDGGRIDI